MPEFYVEISHPDNKYQVTPIKDYILTLEGTPAGLPYGSSSGHWADSGKMWTEQLKETVPDNEFCNDFIERLNTLENDPEPYYAIGFIEHYEPYRWAWYIIVNKYEVRNLTEEEILLENKLFDTFLKSKNIKFWNIEDDKN